jgi:GNAT superfamily N-acetyltransferase
MGYVAELDDSFAGFLTGRIGPWDSEPPIVASRKLAWIDGLCVVDAYRRTGVASALVGRAMDRARASGVSRIETMFPVDDPGAGALWASLGFVSSVTRASLELDS